MGAMSPTLAADEAWPAALIAAAEAPLTAGTDRYMRAAAHAVAAAALHELGEHRGGAAGARVLALAGGGHNGADTLLAAAALARRGCAVSAALATDHPLPGALHRARAAGVRIADSPREAVGGFLEAGGDLVLDGLTGIGASGGLRPRAAALIAPLLDRTAGSAAGARAGGRPFRVLAVDLPSGTGVDDGTLPGPVLPADRTVTFTCLKAALCLPPACRLAGRVEVVDLGLPVPQGPPIVVRPTRSRPALPSPGPEDHKYTRGVVGLWAGSESYPGAGLLAASGAARAGAGMVRLHAPRRVEDLVLAARPEVVPAPGRCQAAVLGPGTDPADAPRAVELRTVLSACLGEGAALRAGAPAVIDAGALPLLADLVARGGRCGPQHLLTPHAGEAAAVLSALAGAGRPDWDRTRVESDPGRAALRLSELTGATVLLKGSPTLIASPGRPLCSVPAGPGWAGTAGSGDVLAGILGALLAGAAVAWEEGDRAPGAHEVVPVAAAAVRLHSRAGRLASAQGGLSAPIVAMDIADAVPRAWAALLAGS
ncbi:bifunctional ADP-dependent NAD(P)H-hydrate dehydratase/NAD(P)H-hydrate epimerase [Actinomyces bowdenii]|uniref:ADP-dependent (S)-NAD(P)H-hydrate dehydratase n=1 Tax=Actinomyces bowdenii TaxID=131109 RepID=A0A3P1VDU3_9ACTO|nr:bifunctional ADP-dependent NAD(P)H-hydrate dehydratase/NAD(P)H-hydrate epimerase [Actinomyces bowdenii]